MVFSGGWTWFGFQMQGQSLEFAMDIWGTWLHGAMHFGDQEVKISTLIASEANTI
jgi:hypothetical protein